MDQKENPDIGDFAVITSDKLRYCDTDRQGHVNNAVFSSFLETGRVEILYDPNKGLASSGCSFVIASLKLDFLGEVNWPGEVQIGSRIGRIGSSSITFEQGLFQNGTCVATALTVIVQVNDATKKAQPLGGLAVASLLRLHAGKSK